MYLPAVTGLLVSKIVVWLGVMASLALRSLRHRSLPSLPSYYAIRCMTTNSPPKTQLKSSNHVSPKTSWLTRKVEESPMWRALFFQFTNVIGYGSPKQMAGRRAFILYDKICAVKPDEDRAFWQNGELIGRGCFFFY